MAAPDTILLIVLSLLVSLTTWLGVRLYQAVMDDLVPSVEALRQQIYGRKQDDGDGGVVGDISELKDTIEESQEERRKEHEQVGNRLNNVQQALRDLRSNQQNIANSLQRSDSVDLDVDINNDNGDRD